jgi:Neocarzinostatin family
MRIPRIVAACGIAATVLAGGQLASAQTVNDVTVTPSTGLVDGSVVAVAGSNFTSTNIVYVMQCARDGNNIPAGQPGFDWTLECNSSFNRNPAVSGGNFTTNLTVFAGPEPDGAPFECTPTVPCWIRIAPNNPGDVNNDLFKQITFGGTTPTTTTTPPTTTIPDPEIPEAPINVLLPISVAAAAGAALFFARRRTRPTA